MAVRVVERVGDHDKDEVVAAAAQVCESIDEDGVEVGSRQASFALLGDGFSIDEASSIVVAGVTTLCPEYLVDFTAMLGRTDDSTTTTSAVDPKVEAYWKEIEGRSDGSVGLAEALLYGQDLCSAVATEGVDAARIEFEGRYLDDPISAGLILGSAGRNLRPEHYDLLQIVAAGMYIP